MFFICRNLGRAIFLAIPMITILFVLVNLSFFAVLTYSEIQEAESVGLVSTNSLLSVVLHSFCPTCVVAQTQTFGHVLLGDPGMVVVCVMVVIMMLGGLHGSIIDASR